MSKKQEVQTSNTAVAEAMTVGDWGAPQISSKDIIVPKILCMQGLSELVTEDKAKMGDFVDNLTKEVIGNYTHKPIPFIPFHLDKVWITSTKTTGKDFEFKGIEAVTAENENRRYTEVVDGVEYKHDYTMNFYVLLPGNNTIPYIVSFKGMSGKAGRVLATQMFVRNAAAGKVPPAYVMELGGTKEKNDKGTFIVLNTAVKRESTQEEVDAAFGWYKTVTAGGVKVHEEEAVTAKPETNERY